MRRVGGRSGARQGQVRRGQIWVGAKDWLGHTYPTWESKQMNGPPYMNLSSFSKMGGENTKSVSFCTLPHAEC
jgi:hypothetical protein